MNSDLLTVVFMVLPLSYRPSDRIRFDSQPSHGPANTGDCYTVLLSRDRWRTVGIEEVGYSFAYLAGLAGGHD